MSYYSKIFERLDIQQIREFLLYGTECIQKDPRSYKQRMDTASDEMHKLLDELFPDRSEREKIADAICDYSDECKSVYMEIGLQCGLKLAAQIWKNTGTDRE